MTRYIDDVSEFKTLLLRGEQVSQCSYVEIDRVCRLYYIMFQESSFEFVAVEWACGESDKWEHLLDDPECQVHVVFSGVAYFDGVRHLYMGDDKVDMLGYANYPKLTRYIAVLEAIQKLEIELTQARNFGK